MVQLFAETLRIICEGELRQLFSSGQWRQPKDTYYERIFAKTASLFAAATRSAAILAGAPAGQEQALYDYGYHLGMAFQIVDDILDFTGDEAVLGKPVGSDLRQGIVTLPFFYFLEAHPAPDELLARLDGGRNGDQVTQVVTDIRRSDAIKNATNEARAFVEQAHKDLQVLPEGTYRQAMHELADFVVSRHV